MNVKYAVPLIVTGVVMLVLVLILLDYAQEKKGKALKNEKDRRIGDEVVATYVGGEITAGELRRYLNDFAMREGKHEVCTKHGSEHTQCSMDEDCENHPLDSVESYRMMLKKLVLEKMVNRWISEKGMASRKDASHRIKHLVEEINLESIAGEMHSDKLKPDKVEMRQYYEEHRDEFKDRSYDQVEKDIESRLTAKKQSEYIPKYIEELKANAVIEKNYDLLKVSEPTESEISAYYESHRKEYVQSEYLRVQTIRISASDEKAGREKAEKALSRLRAGEDFTAVASEFSDDKAAAAEVIERGRKSKEFEERVFRCYPGELTPVFKDGGSFNVVKVIERQGEKQKPLSEVKSNVKTALSLMRQQEKMKFNGTMALFSIHGKQFTVEQFQEEFNELTPEQQAQYSSFEARKNLLDQLIVRELLLEKNEDKGQTQKQRKEIDELKEQALQEMLHKEEVDEKLVVSEEEAKAFYEKRQAYMREPAKAKISIIRASFGSAQDERNRARKKLEEAQEKLKAGADFATVAREYSDDQSATGGGEVDRWIYEGKSHLGEYYEHEFHEEVFKLKTGQVGDIFEFSQNYWIVKVKENVPSQQMSFEEARPMIESYIKSSKHRSRMGEMQNELLEKSQLVIRDHVLSRNLRVESGLHQKERDLY